MKAVKSFLFYWSIFSVGLFGGEWLIDFIFNLSRDKLTSEILDSVIVGFIVALLIIGNKSINKYK